MEKNYDFKQTEKAMQTLWQENKIYAYDETSSLPIYSIDTPPPTVSGSLHIGHIFSYTQAEIIARFKRMQGHNVFYPFGFDDNGLPTERLVEKVEGIRAKDLSRSVFGAKCMETTQKYEAQFVDLWKSLGFSVDWSLQYHTISPVVQRISQRSFLDMIQKKKAYSKESPVLWCTECQTSIAQAELETKEMETQFHQILFALADEGGSKPLTIATTRPELLYGCVCLFVHPEDERYMSLIGKKAIVPLYNYEIPILGDEEVSMEKGTGIVMCATFGDQTDAMWYEKHDLPYRPVIMSDGRLDANVPTIGGMKVKAARQAIVGLLKEHDLLTSSTALSHAVGIHERCGHEIEIILSKQWYIDVLSEKERLLQAADQINWYPAYMKNRYCAWVENLKWDWCISRQRYFGVPFPVWYCETCGKAHFAQEEQLPVNPIETNCTQTCTCGGTSFVPEIAVFDTWATSSVTPQINSLFGETNDRSEKLMPMSMRTQAHEIIRTWAFYTIVKSLYHTGDIPWKDMMICGFVMAKKGEKISKSKNNAPLSPTALIESHSADVLRYWVANAKLGTDTFFEESELSTAKRFITKLWNACKFAMSHLDDYKPVPMNVSELMPIDRWMVERTQQTMNRAIAQLDIYEIGSARHEIDELFWKDFCDDYVEIIKERLYQPEKHGSQQRLSGQRALYESLLNILKMYAIYVPHITEHLYQSFFRIQSSQMSIHQLQWEKTDGIDQEILEFGEKLQNVISEMRKYKSIRNLSMKTEIDFIEIQTDTQLLAYFEKTEKDILACSKAGELRLIVG